MDTRLWRGPEAFCTTVAAQFRACPPTESPITLQAVAPTSADAPLQELAWLTLACGVRVETVTSGWDPVHAILGWSQTPAWVCAIQASMNQSAINEFTACVGPAEVMGLGLFVALNQTE